ncbi:uncharacterized protein K489DRAFT_385469, partial [Dissoconium aciculare CBS 342.82]|uniref:Uncharacterized protein n=1 Tax=Dissoconium aciculare CBS 342.82 TaxID=1314786 RepID=A0A6J3LTA8_9PEZI
MHNKKSAIPNQREAPRRSTFLLFSLAPRTSSLRHAREWASECCYISPDVKKSKGTDMAPPWGVLLRPFHTGDASPRRRYCQM